MSIDLNPLSSSGADVPDSTDNPALETPSLAAPMAAQGSIAPLAASQSSSSSYTPLTASELISKYANLPLAAIGMMLVIEMMKGKTDASLETLEFTRLTSKKLRYDIMLGNLKTVEQLKNVENNDNIGIAASGKIANNENCWDRWGNWVIGVLISVLLLAVCPVMLLGLMLVTQVVQLLQNAGVIDAKQGFLKDFLEVMSFTNPINAVAEGVILTLEETGAIDEKQAAKARSISAIVVAAVMFVITVVAAIVVTVCSFGTAALPAAAAIAMAVASLVTAILTIVNGVFAIKKGIEAWENAKEVLKLENLQAIVESIKTALANMASIIDSIIKSLKDDIDVVVTEFNRISAVIKIEGDTKLSIARNITI